MLYLAVKPGFPEENQAMQYIALVRPVVLARYRCLTFMADAVFGVGAVIGIAPKLL